MQGKKDIIDRIIKNMIDAIRKRKVTIISLASIVVVVTVYSLILPAMTLEKDEAAKMGGIELPAAEEVQDEEKAASAAEEKQAEKESEKEAEKEPEKEPEKETVQNPAEKPQEANSESDNKGLITRKTELTKDGKDYSVSVLVGKNAELPQNTVLSVKEIKKDGTTVEAGTNKKTRTAEESGLDYDKLYKEAKKTIKKTNKNIDINSIRFYDITLLSGDDSVEPSADVDVKITLDSIEKNNDEAEYHIVHFGEEKTEVLGSKTKDDEISFKTDGFSVYAVIEEGIQPESRMCIKFHVIEADGTDIIRSTVYVKNSDATATDADEKLKMIIYDPGVGELDEDESETFRGWTFNDEYTVAEATTQFNGDLSDPYGAMTIQDIRDWAKSKGGTITEQDGIVTYDVYAMILKHYSVQYLDRFAQSLATDAAYMKRNETTSNYKVMMNYDTNDEDYHFKGWITNDGENVTTQATLEKVIEHETGYDGEYDLYTNNTDVVISGDVVFKAHAPKGKWLIFHEIEKGATYTAPQFLEEGQSPEMPDPDNMLLLGYTFDGWYYMELDSDGNPVERDGKLVIDESRPYTPGPISEKTHIGAKWTPATWAPYTVIIWKQNLDGSYAYAESIQLAGNVGTTISAPTLSIVNNNDADYLNINGQSYDHQPVRRSFQARHLGRTGTTHNYENPDYIGFNCARIDEGVRINPEGNSVVNVYYDRIEYTIKIYYARSSGNNYQVATTRTGTNDSNPLGPSAANYGMNWTGNILHYKNQNGNWVNNGGYKNYIPSDEVHSETSGGYTYYYTTLTAKYGENIAEEWPRYSLFPDLATGATNNNNNTYGFVSWYMMSDAGGYQGAGSGLNTFKGIISKMDEKLLGDITSSTGNLLFGRYDQRDLYYYTYQIWYDTLDGVDYSDKRTTVWNGKTYYLADEFVANSAASDPTKATQAPTYSGYTNVRSVQPAPVNHRSTCEFYYNRVVNPIVYRDGSYFDGNGNRLNAYPALGSDQESEPIPYETNISSYGGGYNAAGELVAGDNYKTDYPSSYDGFVFEGWYTDSTCTTPYNFNRTMPDSSITVYAKFRQKQYRVFLHPNVPDEKVVYWGTTTQQMNFRGTYGNTISTPSGVLIQDEDHPEILDGSYEFMGWYTDPQFKHPYDDDAFVLNDDITTPYDKEHDMTDPMDKYGKITDPNNATNSDAENGRWWITKKLDLYARWSKIIADSEGIQVKYDPNGGKINGSSDPVTDPTYYKDGTSAVAQGAPDQPPANKVFLYWVLQKWNPEGGDDGTGAFEDVSPLEFAYPGDVFTVSYNNAQEIVNKDPITGEVISKEYYVQLRAEYGDKERETPTHIDWYPNYGDNFATHSDKNLLINQETDIHAPLTRTGYTFLGWARVRTTDSHSHEVEGHDMPQGDVLNLDEDDLFLKYENGKYYAQNKDNEWVEVTQVAADEETPYHDIYAIWACKVTVQKVVQSSEDDDKNIDFEFEATIGSASDSDEFTLRHDHTKEYYVAEHGSITVEETLLDNFNTSIKVIKDSSQQEVTQGITVNGGQITVSDVGENITIIYTNSKQMMPIKVVKIDQTDTPLAGATFHITGGGINETKTSTYNQDHSEAIIYENDAMPVGEYTMQETVTPDGFLPLDGDVKIKVEEGTSGLNLSVTINGVAIPDNLIVVDSATNLHTIKIMNSTGQELPMTGGSGTTVIYFLGMLLLLGSFIGLVAKKRVE